MHHLDCVGLVLKEEHTFVARPPISLFRNKCSEVSRFTRVYLFKKILKHFLAFAIPKCSWCQAAEPLPVEEAMVHLRSAETKQEETRGFFMISLVGPGK